MPAKRIHHWSRSRRSRTAHKCCNFIAMGLARHERAYAAVAAENLAKDCTDWSRVAPYRANRLAVKCEYGCDNLRGRIPTRRPKQPMSAIFDNPTRVLAASLAALLCLSLLTGCPAYEDKYTGTYREVNPGDRDGKQALQIDFFRFGENASAVVRFYDIQGAQGDPFDDENEVACAWTSAEEFTPDAQWDFRLYLEDSSKLPRSRLFGNVDDGGDGLDVSLFDETDDNPSTVYKDIRQLELERVDREANPNCDTIKDYFVEFSFPRDPETGDFQSMPERANYEIENPVFVVSWLGVEQTESGGQTFLAPVSEHEPAFRLDTSTSNSFDPDTHTLRNEFTVGIPAPDLRMNNGDTAMSLGQFSVVDDSESIESIDLENWVFDWNPSFEKMVASSLQPAFRPDCPDDTNRFGRALLFVEDSIWDLGENVLTYLIDGEEQIERNSERHFFVVDVCAEDDQVLKILINEPFFTGQVPLKVTDQFLNTDQVPLPRVNPYNFN